MSYKRFNRRKEAKQQLSLLSKDPNHVIIIHYSCESFYERAGKGSPRVTSIGVRNFQNAQTISFSIHKYAEIEGVPFDEIDQKYNDLEKKMLDEFYEYLESHLEYKFVHWSMRDENYGFGAIAHRYRVLGGKPISIHESNLFDISRILVGFYGVNYIGHPRLTNIMEKNKVTNKDFLSGAEEAEAFESKEYHKLHLSTLRKVDSIANILERILNGTLKHNSKFSDIYGNNIEALMILSREHPVVGFIGFLGSLASIVGLVLAIK